MNDDIIKYYAASEGAPKFEINAKTYNEAVNYIKTNFRGSGDIRLIEVVYREILATPHIVKT